MDTASKQVSNSPVLSDDWDPEKLLGNFRGTVLQFDDPTEPVGEEDWESLR